MHSKNLLLAAQLLLLLIGTGVFAADTDEKFWVFDDKGVYIVNPADGNKEELYRNEDLCSPGEDCSNWGYPGTDGQYVVVANYNGQNPTKPGNVMAFEADTGKLVANVKTCNLPFTLDFAPWRHEVYVHCWFRPGDDQTQPEDGLVDVLSTNNWGLKNPWIGAAHNSGYMHAYIALSKELKQYAWGTNMQDPGIHRIDLETRESKFFNLRASGCTGGAGIVISDVNKHGFLKCNPGGVSMVLELDLEAEEVEVVQKIEVDGTPYVTEDGKYIAITDEKKHELHIFEAKSNGQTNKISVISDPDIEGFSQLAFAVSGSEHVAVITSFSQNKVLLVDMESVEANPNAPLTAVIDLPDDPDHDYNSTAQLGQHGGQRQLAAGANANGQLYAMVSAQSLSQTHILTISTSPLTATIEDVDNVMGSSPKLFFMPFSTGPEPAVVTQRSYASAAQVEQLKARVTMLEEGLWGAQLSENFWVFTDDGMHVIDAVMGEEIHFLNASEGICDGTCSWGYPETDGTSFVAVPNRASNEVFVFDIHTGGIKARVPTCSSPYRVEPVPWANELLVHCWQRPGEDSFSDNQDGIVDVLSTSKWGIRNPLIDALFTSTEYIHGDVLVNEALPSFAWSINFADPGVHKISMEDRKSEFVNLQAEGCFGVYNMAISATNRHAFMECPSGSEFSSPRIILEMNLEQDKVVPNPDLKNHQGTPYVSKDGKFIVLMANDKLQVFEAKENGKPSAFVTEIDKSDDIEGFSKLAFIQGKNGEHVAVVTSLTQNKVLLLDMDSLETSSPKTKVVTLPEDPSSSQDSTADVSNHGGGRQIAAGTMEDGRMVALVSAQSIETVHVLNLGSSGSPLDAVEVKHDVEGVPGALPKMVFVPLASHKEHVSTVQQQVASVGLLEAAKEKMKEIESMANQEVSSLRTSMQSGMADANQKMQQLESSVAEANSELQALRTKVTQLSQKSSSDDGTSGNGGGSNSASSSSTDSKAIAIAGVVLACVAIAALMVMAVVLMAKAGSSGPLDCVQQSQGSFQRFEQMKYNEYNNPATHTPVFENGASKV